MLPGSHIKSLIPQNVDSKSVCCVRLSWQSLTQSLSLRLAVHILWDEVLDDSFPEA